MADWFARELARLSAGNRGTPLVFYCLRDCWMSWNAGKRALAAGATARVLWFSRRQRRLAETGLPLEDAAPLPHARRVDPRRAASCPLARSVAANGQRQQHRRLQTRSPRPAQRQPLPEEQSAGVSPENGFTASTARRWILHFHSDLQRGGQKNTRNAKFITPAKFSIWFTPANQHPRHFNQHARDQQRKRR